MRSASTTVHRLGGPSRVGTFTSALPVCDPARTSRPIVRAGRRGSDLDNPPATHPTTRGTLTLPRRCARPPAQATFFCLFFFPQKTNPCAPPLQAIRRPRSLYGWRSTTRARSSCCRGHAVRHRRAHELATGPRPVIAVLALPAVRDIPARSSTHAPRDDTARHPSRLAIERIIVHGISQRRGFSPRLRPARFQNRDELRPQLFDGSSTTSRPSTRESSTTALALAVSARHPSSTSGDGDLPPERVFPFAEPAAVRENDPGSPPVFW